MSAWWRVRRDPDGHLPAPPASTDWFVDATTQEYGWARSYPGPDEAARDWVRTARAVAVRVGGRPVAIVGDGALAGLIRQQTTHSATPVVVVDTTGTAEGIGAALDVVSTGGVVYLAVRPLWTRTPVRTYHDVHRRGITLKPVPWAGGAAAGAGTDDLLAWALLHLATAEPGRPLKPAPWHHIARSPKQVTP